MLTQALKTARRICQDENTIREALIEVARRVGQFDCDRSPAETSYETLLVLQRFLGVDDPYKDEKVHYNRLVLGMEDHLQEMIDGSDDPLHMAVLLASVGNMIDLGIISGVNVGDEIARALDRGFAVNDYELLRERLETARTIVYVLDNAGEIVFDKLLIRMLTADHEVAAVVRKSPILNDVTMEDAVAVGLTGICEVIDTGCDVFGVPIPLVSPEFLARFDAADVRIAKGHANFETLNGSGREVFFVLKAKCPCVANELGVDVFDSVLKCQAAHEVVPS